MTEYLSLFVLAFAVSLDSFGVGLTYGLRRMKLPLLSVVFIMTCSSIAILLAMWIGNQISSFLSPDGAKTIGGMILIGIGTFTVYQVYRQPVKTKKPRIQERMLMNLEIKQLGIVINVLKKPMEADLDDSGSINGNEAILLGIALSLDAFGAGIGAAFLGVSPWLLAGSVGIMCGLFLSLGKISGTQLFRYEKTKHLSFLPGILLILIGLIKL